MQPCKATNLFAVFDNILFCLITYISLRLDTFVISVLERKKTVYTYINLPRCISYPSYINASIMTRFTLC